MGYSSYILGFTLIINVSQAAQNPPECITRIGKMDICQYGDELAARSVRSLPEALSPKVKLVKITNDKNRLSLFLVGTFTESEVLKQIEQRGITKDLYKQEFLSALQTMLCKPQQATRKFIDNGGIARPQVVSAEGTILAVGDIESCNQRITVNTQKQQKGPLNLTVTRAPTLQQVDIPPSSELQFVLSTYADSVVRKFGQTINIPHDENGNSVTTRITVKLVIDANGNLIEMMPSVETDSLSRMAIRQAHDASPYPVPPPALLKVGNTATVSFEYGAEKHSYSRADKEFYDR